MAMHIYHYLAGVVMTNACKALFRTFGTVSLYSHNNAVDCGHCHCCDGGSFHCLLTFAGDLLWVTLC